MRDVHIVTRLEVERRNRGWTQRELGKQVGASHAVIGRIERGEVIAPHCKERLEALFGMPYERLLEVIV